MPSWSCAFGSKPSRVWYGCQVVPAEIGAAGDVGRVGRILWQ